MRMLLCVTMKTRLHRFGEKNYYWCTKENICLWEADGEMTTMGLLISYSSVGKSFVLDKANKTHSFSSTWISQVVLVQKLLQTLFKAGNDNVAVLVHCHLQFCAFVYGFNFLELLT